MTWQSDRLRKRWEITAFPIQALSLLPTSNLKPIYSTSSGTPCLFWVARKARVYIRMCILATEHKPGTIGLGYDERADTVEIQTTEGDLDEIGGEAWRSLPLVLTEQSQDWTASIDNDPANDDMKPRRTRARAAKTKMPTSMPEFNVEPNTAAPTCNDYEPEEGSLGSSRGRCRSDQRPAKRGERKFAVCLVGAGRNKPIGRRVRCLHAGR